MKRAVRERLNRIVSKELGIPASDIDSIMGTFWSRLRGYFHGLHRTAYQVPSLGTFLLIPKRVETRIAYYERVLEAKKRVVIAFPEDEKLAKDCTLVSTTLDRFREIHSFMLSEFERKAHFKFLRHGPED